MARRGGYVESVDAGRIVVRVDHNETQAGEAEWIYINDQVHKI